MGGGAAPGGTKPLEYVLGGRGLGGIVRGYLRGGGGLSSAPWGSKAQLFVKIVYSKYSKFIRTRI